MEIVEVVRESSGFEGWPVWVVVLLFRMGDLESCGFRYLDIYQ
jgi:hypothetical protein